MERLRRSGTKPNHCRRPWALTLAALVVMCAGCSEGTRDLPQDEVRDADIVSVVVPPLDSIRTSAWTSRSVYNTLGMDSLLIGGGESLFARFLPDGSLATANSPRIVILKSDGSFGRTLTRDGDGPGEFRVISSLGLGSDGSIFASDHLTAKFSELSPSGGLQRSIPRLLPISEDLATHPFAVLADGKIIAAPSQSRPARKPAANVEAGRIARDEVPIVTDDSTGQILDRLLLLPGLERSDGFVAPFPQSALYAGRGRWWVTGVSDSLDLMVFDETHPTIHLLARRLAVSASRQAREKRDSLIKQQLGAEMGVAVRERQAGMPATELLPDIGGVSVAQDGAIWVGNHATPGGAERRWYVVGTDGRCLGQLSLSVFGGPLVTSRTELLDAADDRVALIRESSDGEAYIEVRDVIRAQPSSPLGANGCARASSN